MKTDHSRNSIKEIKWIEEPHSPTGRRKVVICEINGKNRTIQILDDEELVLHQQLRELYA